eukprot:tig00021434_g21322.t1
MISRGFHSFRVLCIMLLVVAVARAQPPAEEASCSIDATCILVDASVSESCCTSSRLTNTLAKTGSRIQGSQLINGTIEGESIVTDSQLRNVSVSLASSVKASVLSYVTVNASTLDAVVSEGAYFDSSRFSRCRTFAGGNFVRSTCGGGGVLEGAYLRGAELLAAVLKDASVNDSRLEGVQGANISVSGSRLLDVNATDSRFEESEAAGVRARNASVSGAVVSDSMLLHVRLEPGSSVSGSQVESSLVAGSRLEGARVRGALVRNSTVTNATLVGASVVNEDVTGRSIVCEPCPEAPDDRRLCDPALCPQANGAAGAPLGRFGLRALALALGASLLASFLS